MAELREKRVVKLESEWKGPYHEEYNGKKQQFWEALAVVNGGRGDEQIVIRTGSEKLRDSIQPGMTLKGMSFKTETSKVWRFKVFAKDNLESDAGAYGGQRAASGIAPQPSSYTLADLVTLYERCYDHACTILGEDDDKVAGAATLFIQATRYNIKAERSVPSAPTRDDDPPPPPDKGEPTSDSDALPF